MSPTVGASALAFLAVASIAHCSRRQPVAESAAAAVNTTAPAAPPPLELKLPMYPSGQLHDLAEDRGHVVLLDVWATWCEPCQESLPEYAELLAQFGDRGLRVYAMNVDEDPAQIAPFVHRTRLALPVLLDTGAVNAENVLGVERLPTTFLLDRRGVIRQVHRGFDDSSVAAYRLEIESLLREAAAAP